MGLNIKNIESREIFPGFHGKLIHTQQMSLAYWDVEAGSEVPEHSHVHEQLMQVLEGRFQFTLNGVSAECEAGDVIVIPPHAKHSGKALTDCKIMDIFSPVREDYR